MELRLRIGIFTLVEQVRSLWKELEGQRRPDDRFSVVLRHRTDHVRIAETHMAKGARDGRGADIPERVDQFFGRPGDVGSMRHCGLRFEMRHQFVTEPSRRVRCGASQKRKLSACSACFIDLDAEPRQVADRIVDAVEPRLYGEEVGIVEAELDFRRPCFEPRKVGHRRCKMHRRGRAYRA
jgi:hypothetical protein